MGQLVGSLFVSLFFMDVGVKSDREDCAGSGISA